jgi:hypothetical protein
MKIFFARKLAVMRPTGCAYRILSAAIYENLAAHPASGGKADRDQHGADVAFAKADIGRVVDCWWYSAIRDAFTTI